MPARDTRPSWTQLLLVFGVAVLAIVWRFLPWMPSVFYGDDLDYLLLFEDGRCATTAAEILTATCYERFRPVASSVVMGLMAIADRDINYHLAVNVVLHGLITTMVYVLSHRLSGGRWLVALALAMAVALSRFATFEVTQMIGPVESLTLLSTLVAVFAVLRVDARVDHAWRWGWIAIAATFVAIHTHERSMVVAVWLAIAFLVSPSVRALSRARWMGLLAGCVALPLFYIAYKTLVLDAHFLVGTGGTHVDLQLPMMLQHLSEAALSLLAFNTGPDYLVGASVTSAWRIAWLLALGFACAWIGTIAMGTRQAFLNKDMSPEPVWLQLRWLFLLLLLAAFLLAPALITIRLEQRWLLPPFAVGLLTVAWAVGRLTSHHRASTVVGALAVLLSFASVAVDTLVMRFYDRAYFVSSPRFAALVKRDIIDPNPGQSTDIALLAGASQCDWTLFKGGFFRIYGGKARTVHCFVTLADARNAGLPAGSRIYGPDGPERLVDLTEKQMPVAQSKLVDARVDFIDDFAKGRINDTRYVATPTGLGALLLPVDSKDGPRHTLSVISGFVYRFDDIAIEQDDQLYFGVGMIYPANQPARAIVRVEVQGQSAEILYSRELTPPAADAKPSFPDVSLALSKYAGQRVSLTFATESPGGDSTAHWIGYAEPSISHHRSR